MFYTDACIKPWFVILYRQVAVSWLISFKNNPHYYAKNPRPKSSDICHLPRRWAALSIPPSQTAAAKSRTACAPLPCKCGRRCQRWLSSSWLTGEAVSKPVETLAPMGFGVRVHYPGDRAGRGVGQVLLTHALAFEKNASPKR